MNKETDMTMKLNPYFESTIETSNVVWSHDENSYQFNFDFTNYLCDKPFELTDGKPRILLEFLNDKNAEVQIYPLVVDSEKLGVAHFVIPDKILGYAGDVKASLTIDFSNKSYDLGNFSFRMKKSPIDNKMPQLQFYVDEFEKAIEKAERLDLVTKPELEQELQKVQSGFLGEFNSVAELKSKYPNGTNGYAVVFENSVGYTYTYKNNVWTKGNVWNGMAIADDSITENKIANNQITRWKIKDGEVIGAKLSDLAVHTININNFAVTNEKLAGKSVTGSKIDNETIVETNIKPNAITGKLIKGHAIQEEHLAFGSVGNLNISNESITVHKTNFIDVKIGKNLFNKDDIILNKEVSSVDGHLTDRDDYFTSNFIKVKPSSTIACSHFGRMALFDENMQFVQGVEPKNSRLINIPSNVHYLMKSLEYNNKDFLQIEYGSSSTTYEPYTQKNTLKGIDLSGELSEYGSFISNEIANADFSKEKGNWVISDFTPNFNGKELTMSSLTRNEMSLAQKLTTTDKPKKGEVWYMSIESKNVNAGVKNAYFHFRDWITSGTLNKFLNINKSTDMKKYSDLVEIKQDFLDYISFYVRIELNEVKEKQQYIVQKPMCINLTALYGKGNEPTLEEFENLLKISGKDFIVGKENVFNAKATQELQAKQLEINKDVENRLAVAEKTGGGIFSGAQKTRNQTLTKASPYTFTQTSGSTLPRKKMWVITYDDDSKTLIDYALPIHQKYKIPAIFYVIPDHIGTGEDYNYGPSLNWEDIRTLEQNGFDIGHHTYQHKSTGYMNRQQLITNIETGNKIFIENGFSPTHFCHPGGSNTMENSIILTEYFDSCVLTVNALNGYDCNPWRLNRKSSDDYAHNRFKYIDQLLADDSNDWLMTYHHAIHPDGKVTGVLGEMKCWTPTDLSEAIEYAQEKGVEIVTMDDALRTYAPHVYLFNEEKQPIFSVQRDGKVVQ